MRSHGIWNSIESDSYKTDKSHGARSEWANYVNVGTSRSNSHPFAAIRVTREYVDTSHIKPNGAPVLPSHWLVRLWVDGVCVKLQRFTGSTRPTEWNKFDDWHIQQGAQS